MLLSFYNRFFLSAIVIIIIIIIIIMIQSGELERYAERVGQAKPHQKRTLAHKVDP